ncbi:MAG: carbon-nitrogen hydrolase family protein [Acidimicrobiia bacterium]|nr:carbon-nitrogen hydrolase family protein [Acidimicrobiia bacterium]
MRPDDPALGPTTIRVGCANFEAVPRDKAATIAKLSAVVDEAADRGCDLVVFPELAINTWGGCPDCAAEHRPCAWHLDQAELADGPTADAIAELAADRGIHVIYGFEETNTDDATVVHNSANLVGPDGLIGTYRKLHLGIPLETDRFTPGDELPVFDTALGPIAISICYDFYNGPELCRVQALKGARLLVNPTGRGDLPRAREHLEQCTLIRAHENVIFAASSNRTGDSHGPAWAGGSVIAAPRYPGFPEVLARAGPDEELIDAELDFTSIGGWYDIMPWREWRAGPQSPITRLVADELAALGSD